MSKPNDHILLLPGESGWELWSRQPDGAFALLRGSEHQLAGEFEDLPGGELTLLFPARVLTALPMRVQTGDPALYEDLVMLQGERMGLRPDPLAGRLVDYFTVAHEEDRSTLLATFLRPPQVGELPARSPGSFDVLARCFKVEGSAVVLWKELGRWVFAVFDHGKLLFFQATAVDALMPDEALAREIKLSLMQLSIQGLQVRPARIELWSSQPTIDCSGIKAVFDLPVQTASRPVPVWPEPVSRLLPEDVRAARDLARRKQLIRFGVIGVAAVYLALVAWLGYGLWSLSSRAGRLEAKARDLAPEGEAYAEHMKKWNELADAVDRDHLPVEILMQIHDCIPPQSGLRLELAEISADSVRLRGSSSDFTKVQSFNLNLDKHKALSRYVWEKPEPTQSGEGWKFTYTAFVPNAETQP